MQFLYLSGQGRRAVDSKIAQITFAQLQNSSADFVPREQQGSGNGIRVQLDGYTLNSLSFEERIDLNTTAARGFAQYPLSVSQIDQTTTTGNSTLWQGNFTISPPLAVNARLFPGRQTTLQMKLNDAILDTQTVGGVTSPTFNRTQFESENYDPVDNRINGFLSDHVAFDLRQMAAADRPSMSGGAPAERTWHLPPANADCGPKRAGHLRGDRTGSARAVGPERQHADGPAGHLASAHGCSGLLPNPAVRDGGDPESR